MFGRKRNNYTSFSCGGKFSPSRQWQPSTYKQARKGIPLKRLVLWKREKTLKLIITFFLTQKMRKIYVLNFSLGVRVTRNPNSLTSLVKSLTKTQGMVVIDLSHIPVNKCTNSRLGWTNYSDLYGFAPEPRPHFFMSAHWSVMRESWRSYSLLIWKKKKSHR